MPGPPCLVMGYTLGEAFAPKSPIGPFMRILKVVALGLALLAGACSEPEQASQSPPAVSVKTEDRPTAPPPMVLPSEGLDDGAVRAEARGKPSAPPPAQPARRPSAPPAKSSTSAKGDLQRLQGAWVAVDAEYDGGKEMPPGGVKWVFRGDICEVWIGGAKMETQQITLDPTKRLKTIDVRPAGGLMGHRVKGIYRLDGDSLKVCYHTPGQEYPTEFSAPKGARRISYHFRRN